MITKPEQIASSRPGEASLDQDLAAYKPGQESETSTARSESKPANAIIESNTGYSAPEDLSPEISSEQEISNAFLVPDKQSNIAPDSVGALNPEINTISLPQSLSNESPNNYLGPPEEQGNSTDEDSLGSYKNDVPNSQKLPNKKKQSNVKTSPPKEKYLAPPIDAEFSSVSRPVIDSYLTPPKEDDIADYSGSGNQNKISDDNAEKASSTNIKAGDTQITSKYLPPITSSSDSENKGKASKDIESQPEVQIKDSPPFPQNTDDQLESFAADKPEESGELYGAPLDLEEEEPEELEELGSYGGTAGDDVGAYQPGSSESSANQVDSEGLGSYGGTDGDDLGAYQPGLIANHVDSEGLGSYGGTADEELGAYQPGLSANQVDSEGHGSYGGGDNFIQDNYGSGK